MSKLLSLDIEFNIRKEPLSIGLLRVNQNQIEAIEEFYFNNTVDKKTQKIHGLSKELIQAHSSNKNIKDISNLIKEQNFLVGFDLQNDLKSLDLNPNKFYGTKKIIDLRYLTLFFNLDESLGSLSKKMNIVNKCRGLFPIHTSIMDSLLSYLILEYLVVFIFNKTLEPKELILKNLAEISSLSYYRENWRYEHYYDKYFFLQKELNNIKKANIPKEINGSKHFKVNLSKYTEIYDENFNIIEKFKNKDNESKDVFFKPELDLGYKGGFYHGR